MYQEQRGVNLGGLVLRGLAAILDRWLLVLVIVFFLSPQGPHLRVAWSYTGSSANPVYISCTYLGSRGFVEGYQPGCPWVVWMDGRGDQP